MPQSWATPRALEEREVGLDAGGRDVQVGGEDLAVREPHAGGLPVALDEAGRLDAEPQLDAARDHRPSGDLGRLRVEHPGHDPVRRPTIVTRTPRSASSRAISMPMNPAPTISADVASRRRTRSMIASAATSDLKSCTPGSSAPSIGAWRRLPLAMSSAS